jgi:nucleoside transporter
LNPAIRFRLSTMMFLEYFIWGAWYVTVGTWLSTSLYFSGQQIGLAAGTTAVGATVAPFIVGLVADKWFATEKVLAVLHVLGGIILYTASLQQRFTPIYICLLLYCLCYMPTMALTNSLSFRHLTDTKGQFGGIRVLGSLGWIAAGLFIGNLRIEATALPLRLAADVSVLMGIYCLSLPHTPPLSRMACERASTPLAREVIAILKRPAVAVFALASFFICIPLQFYYAFTNLYLNQTGVQNAASKMTGGQASEVLCMLLIPWFFRRLGVKYMLVAGMAAWVARYLLFAYSNPDARIWMLWGGILLHGICYDFFFVTGQIYIDREAPPALGAAAQGMISFITYGIGMFVGSWLSGAVVDHFSTSAGAGYNWRSIWIFCAGTSLFVMLGFLLTFRESRKTKSIDSESLLIHT